MNKQVYSNIEFAALKEQLNKEILRRSTFSWWDPLTTPSVGEDKTSPFNLPDQGDRIQVDDKTYTINNPSEGSIEPTRNIQYQSQGENPGGQLPDATKNVPNTSAAQFNVDEIRNGLVGLAKIHDINLFYARDEVSGTAFRDTKGIEKVLKDAKNSELNKQLHLSDIPHTKNDPNGGLVNRKNPNYPVTDEVTYPMENGIYVMPSGESDGEETLSHDGPDENNFYDDYGAKPGDSNYKPINTFVSPLVERDWNDQGHDRDQVKEKREEGGIPSSRFGKGPRNPQPGNSYRSRPVMGGVIGSCNVACFKAGTLVETINGPMNIEDIKIGDEVLTQSGKYCKVYDTFERECDDELISIRATGTPIIYTTNEHPFWVKKYIGLGTSNGKFQQLYSEPDWVEAKNIQSRDKLCLRNLQFGNKHIEPGIAYLAGRWLGDGWKTNETTKNGYECEKFHLCCSFEESVELESMMNKTGIEYTKGTPYTCNRYYITKRVAETSPNQKLIDIIRLCGKYSHGKYLSQDIFTWDKESIENLVNGYIGADGYVDKLVNKNRTRTTTVSKKLAYGISLLMRMLGKNPSWYERVYPNNTGFIQGRKVNMRNSYELSMFTGTPTRHYSIYDNENNVVWASVTFKKIPDNKYTVYNISVEDDPTYYADNVLVHNCTGLCYQSCDNECSESCSTTCWNRCGNACTSTCGNVCTGCNTLCYTSCKTKCQTSTGYSCLKAGAKTVNTSSTGGVDGEYAKNTITYTTHTCTGCSYTCQFYPNKKTQCWDSACMGMCFTSCTTSCSTSCFGGCIDNASENSGKYKSGIGRGCSSGCTANCIGLCSGVCEGACIETCWSGCKASCSDNCEWRCSTNCGSGCAQGCTKGCTGCTSCTGSCTGKSNSVTACTKSGCTVTCQHDCNKNCIGWGCRSICGIDSAGACEANCRLSCMASSCTSLCSDACSSYCSSCAKNCGFQCGSCSSQCSTGCSADCNINCTEKCKQSCSTTCVTSCSEECGGCSDLCYSCVGMCIGVCSVKCENGCSNCTNTCGWWCDSSCNRQCFSNCSDRCISTCSGSCATFLKSDTSMKLDGPERPPTAQGYIYPHPKNRSEEQESFKIFRDPKPPVNPNDPNNPDNPDNPPTPPHAIDISTDKNKNMIITINPPELKYDIKQTTLYGGVFTIDQATGNVSVNEDALPGVISVIEPNIDGGGAIFIITVYYDKDHPFNDKDISVKLPFGFETLDPITDSKGNTMIIIQRDMFMYSQGEN